MRNQGHFDRRVVRDAGWARGEGGTNDTASEDRSVPATLGHRLRGVFVGGDRRPRHARAIVPRDVFGAFDQLGRNPAASRLRMHAQALEPCLAAADHAHVDAANDAVILIGYEI
jgi:hypothetical protein